jgi:hypothetical protein
MKKLLDRHGHPLPPFIVMERGESLDVWAAQAQPDHLVALAVRRPIPLLYTVTLNVDMYTHECSVGPWSPDMLCYDRS